MAVKYPTMYNGMYAGDMSKEQMDLIISIRKMDKVEGLKNMIYDFPEELCEQSIDEQRSIREILAETGEDDTQYLGELRDEQTVGVAFMYSSPRSILGDGVGFGKTAEISALLNLLKKNNELTRFIMAVETSADVQTQKELIRFTGLNVILLPSEKYKMEKVIKNTNWGEVDGVVMKHGALRSDLLSRWLSLYLDKDGFSRIFDTFILDESSVIKNDGKKITEYTRNICNIMSRRVHFLNATTFETNLMEVYYQIDIMNPNVLPKKWRIEKDYCSFKSEYYWVKVGGKPEQKKAYSLAGYKNQAQFKESCKLFYFGRARKPRDTNKYKVVEVYPTPEQIEAINKGYRYMEILNSPSNVPDAEIPFEVENVPKLEKLLEIIENNYRGKKVMVYCFHINAQYKIAFELQERGYTTEILNGETPQKERTEIKDRFNTGDTEVLITNIKKSLNLYAGDACILYSMEPTPSKMEQIRGRIDRNIDDKIKEFILLVYKHTDEYRMLTEVVQQRSKDARDLTIDSKTAVDFFIESMQDGE